MHQGPDGTEPADIAGGLNGIISRKLFDQFGRDWDNDPKGQHIHQDGNEDKRNSGFGCLSVIHSILTSWLRHCGLSRGSGAWRDAVMVGPGREGHSNRQIRFCKKGFLRGQLAMPQTESNREYVGFLASELM